ncbi:MAG: MaoC family dehydratase N-terminal domain-containing protein [Chlamydiia bacterium]|nr:MaoC family dehydratase N-terminal domain-containing protein [Chlamydiia bacterium]
MWCTLGRFSRTDFLRHFRSFSEARLDPVPCSTLFIKPEKYGTISKLGIDIAILDLQDSVPKEKKSEARRLISSVFCSEFSSGQEKIIIRLNELDALYELKNDIEAVLNYVYSNQIFGFMLPMIKNAEDIAKYQELIADVAKYKGFAKSPDYYIYPLIETTSAIEEVYKIAQASPYVKGMYFGNADLSTELGSKNSMKTLLYARQRLVMGSAANNIPAMDGPCTRIDSLIALESEAKQSKDMGFQGKIALHPKQLPIINKVFRPSGDDLKWANRIKKIISSDSSVYQAHDQSGREFIGPPHIKRAYKILSIKPMSVTPAEGESVSPRLIRRGAKAETINFFTTNSFQFEIPISEGLLANWDSLVFNTRRVGSNSGFAKKLGFRDRVVPNSLLMTLAASLAVTRLTESAKVHLEFKNAAYLRPVYPGDTISGYFRIISVSESLQGKNSVIGSQHFLKNQEGDVVYQLEKWTLFPKMDIPRFQSDFNSSDLNLPSFKNAFLSLDLSNISSTQPVEKISPNEVIIHSLPKVFGKSEVRSLSYLIKLTNPHHYDPVVYHQEEILVPGPFVIHASVGCASVDFGEIISEEITSCSNLLKVNLEDTLYSMTYVKSVEECKNPALEKLKLVTLGLKNVSIQSLLEESIPNALFDPENMHAAKINSICAHSIPLLINKIACITEYEILRLVTS